MKISDSEPSCPSFLHVLHALHRAKTRDGALVAPPWERRRRSLGDAKPWFMEWSAGRTRVTAAREEKSPVNISLRAYPFPAR